MSCCDTLERRDVLYCSACGMPPEYCEYSPDFETHCDPWLLKHQPELHAILQKLRGKASSKPKKIVTKKETPGDDEDAVDVPSEPWTTEERLIAFYEKYVPDKVSGVPALLQKYAGKEEKLFAAMVSKYGPEPEDPYDAADTADSDTDPLDSADVGALSIEDNKMTPADTKKKRRGAGAKKKDANGGIATRVVVQRVAKNKKRILTVVTGMGTASSDIKLKDVSKALSKRFAGSSSVKDSAIKGVKEIIVQGDHVYDVAEMIVGKFGVPKTCMFVDTEGTGDAAPYAR